MSTSFSWCRKNKKWIMVAILSAVLLIFFFYIYRMRNPTFGYARIEGFQPMQLNMSDPILLSWLGNYTTGLTALVPMNKTAPVTGLLQITSDNNTINASYNNITWAVYTYTQDILILYNLANTDEQLTLRQIPTSTFTKDPEFTKYSFNAANFEKLQFYFIYHRANASASLESISGTDPTNLYDYSLKLFSPLTSLSQFETNFIGGVKPVFPIQYWCN